MSLNVWACSALFHPQERSLDGNGMFISIDRAERQCGMGLYG